MLAMPSATPVCRALPQATKAGALTLDEVLTVQVDNMPLVVIAVLDISLGGDVVLARPDITTTAELKGEADRC